MIRRSPVLLGLVLMALARPLAAQTPEKFENLKVLPKDIPREQLLATMRGFALGLGVRCEYCHQEKAGAAPGPGGNIELDFKSDKKPTKEKARFMLHMVANINDTILARLEHRSDPPVRVMCVTCHRGSPLPKTLETLLVETTNTVGADSAIAMYRKLRDQALTSGRYNFNEITLSEVARTLAASNKTDEALRMLQLDQEFFPQSGNVDFQMGEIYRARGEKDKAVAAYKASLAKQPNNAQAKRRLTELGAA